MLRDVFPRPTTAVELTLVGRFTVRDRADPFWFDDGGLDAAAIGGSADDPIAFTTGLFAPEAYGDLLDLGLPANYRWREFVDTSRLDAGELDPLVPDLTRLEASYSTAGAIRSGSTIARTGLLDIVERYLDQRSTSSTALSIAALGPLAVAAGAVGLIGVLVVRRRRPALTLARARGASARQLLAAQLWEGLLITVPAALAGLALAVAAVPGARQRPVRDRSAGGGGRRHDACWSPRPGRSPGEHAATSTARIRRPSGCRPAGSCSRR